MTQLFVYGVHADCPRRLIKEEFSKYGGVTNVYNSRKGFAFVTMADKNSAESAIEKLHGANMDGQKIKVEKAKSRGNPLGKNRSFISRDEICDLAEYERRGSGRRYGCGLWKWKCGDGGFGEKGGKGRHRRDRSDKRD